MTVQLCGFNPSMQRIDESGYCDVAVVPIKVVTGHGVAKTRVNSDAASSQRRQPPVTRCAKLEFEQAIAP